jgi:hypothetical protein
VLIVVDRLEERGLKSDGVVILEKVLGVIDVKVLESLAA